jgi:IS5 family transposase
VFQHELPFERSSLTRWRQRLGEEQLIALIQESPAVAHKTGALATKDLERVAVYRTVQPKAIAHPTDARLMHRALEKLVDLAKRNGVDLRQSYVRVAKRAAIMIGRYIHAHQFKRARRELRFLRTRLGRLIRDIRRKIAGDTALEERFGVLLALSSRVRAQDQHQRGPKVYSLHAPEVECIGKGKARAPYEFGCKVSLVTPVTKPKGGQFVLHAKALHGNPRACPRAGQRPDPRDGHTLAPVIAAMTQQNGVEPRRIHLDKGYRGHNYPRLRVWISGQVRRVTAAIRREMKRRAAIEPVIGHVKAEHRMGRNYLKGATATAATPCSLPPASTSPCSCAGSRRFCVPSGGHSRLQRPPPPDRQSARLRVLHGRLRISSYEDERPRGRSETNRPRGAAGALLLRFGQRRIDGPEKTRHVERLRDVAEEPGGNAARHVGRHRRRGQGDHWCLARLRQRLESFEHVVAAHARQIEIEHDDVRAVRNRKLDAQRPARR